MILILKSLFVKNFWDNILTLIQHPHTYQFSIVTTIITAFRDNGHYFPCTHKEKTIETLSDFIETVKEFKEDQNDYIAVFKNNQFFGIWINDAEPEPDGEGGWLMPSAVYILLRADKISAGMKAMYEKYTRPKVNPLTPN